MKRTGFAFHEHCMWHDAGPCSVFDQPGGFIQPAPAAENPETKRRLRNLLAVSGLLEQLVPIQAEPAELDDLLRFHTRRYIDELSAMSERGFGDAHAGSMDQFGAVPHVAFVGFHPDLDEEVTGLAASGG
ncbi:MAG: hypothetical protein R3311_02665, partial [Oceanisphaera sp.]|nr:hypothetical protein [Oceanisphaera sp.]